MNRKSRFIPGPGIAVYLRHHNRIAYETFDPFLKTSLPEDAEP